MTRLVSLLPFVQFVPVFPSSTSPAFALFVDAVAVQPVRTCVVATSGCPWTFSSSTAQGVLTVEGFDSTSVIRTNRAWCVGKLTLVNRPVPAPVAIAGPKFITSFDVVTLTPRGNWVGTELPVSSVIWLNVCGAALSMVSDWPFTCVLVLPTAVLQRVPAAVSIVRAAFVLFTEAVAAHPVRGKVVL